MALKFEDFHGQPGVLRALKRSFTAGSVVHAFLIHGDEGCGKKTLAMTLSMALHCEHATDKPCMECGPCRRMLAGTHPDHIELTTDKATLPVKDIRELIEKLSDKPYEGGKRTVILHDADKMNDTAQNAFLKTLEEPDGQTVFFLVTAHKEGLLPTIASRCRPVYMPRLPEETIAGELIKRGIKQDRAEYAARLCQGVMGRALALCGEDEYYKYRDEAAELMQRLRDKDDVPKIAMGWDDKRKAEDGMKLLDALETVLRDVLRVHSGLMPIDAAIEEILDNLTQHFTIQAVTCIMEETVSVRKRLYAHVQWRSAAEPLLFRIVEERKT